jgi:hypothetical protein
MDIMVKKLGINCISSLGDLHRLRCHVALVWMRMNMNRVTQAFRVFCSQMRMDELSCETYQTTLLRNRRCRSCEVLGCD